MRKDLLAAGAAIALSLGTSAYAQGVTTGAANAAGGVGAGVSSGVGTTVQTPNTGAGANGYGNAAGQIDNNGVGANAQGSAGVNAGNSAAAAGGEAGAASELGKLNAAHAGVNTNAGTNSAAGAIATYESQLTAALAIDDEAARTQAITQARQQLAVNSNKQLTPEAVARIDAMLGIQGAAPDTGLR
jgi:hypothetical protein